MKKVALQIIALSHSMAQSTNYAVVLGEKGGSRRLPIVIGAFEAQAIAVAVEGMMPNRPLTHDLFKNSFDTFNIELKEVIINNLLEGVFYSRLVCLHHGELIEIDSRTSDALALAVRFQCPIYTYEFILDTAGVELKESGEFEDDDNDMAEVERQLREEKQRGSSLANYTVEELRTLLQEALTDENYEQAAKIRDEINKRG